MQVRMESFTISEQARRAIRWAADGRRTMCTRKEAQVFIEAAVERALRDLMYRWEGPKVSEAEANGADPRGLASHGRPVAPVAAEASLV